MAEFISEAVTPDVGAFDPGAMLAGLAALPGGFSWRGQHFDIVECLDHRKRSSNEGGASGGERYLRRQYFTVRLETGAVAEIYVERSAPAGSSRQRARRRWYLYTLDALDDALDTPDRPASSGQGRRLDLRDGRGVEGGAHAPRTRDADAERGV